MLKIQEIREIIKLIDQSSIEKFSSESEGQNCIEKREWTASSCNNCSNSTYLFNRKLL